MSSVYFVKEKNYKLILKLINVTDWIKTQGTQDNWQQGFTIQAELSEDSFDENKKIGNAHLGTYLNTRVNKHTTIYLKNEEDTIPVLTVYASRDVGETPSTNIHIYINIVDYNSNFVNLIGFTGSNKVTGILTITSAPVVPPTENGGGTTDTDEPENLISDVYEKQYISVTVTDEEWEWLKGINNE